MGEPKKFEQAADAAREAARQVNDQVREERNAEAQHWRSAKLLYLRGGEEVEVQRVLRVFPYSLVIQDGAGMVQIVAKHAIDRALLKAEVKKKSAE